MLHHFSILFDIFQYDSLLFLGNMFPSCKSNRQHHLACADGSICIFPFWLVARASVKVSLQRLSCIWARGLIVIKSVLNTACWYGSDVEMSDVSPQTQSKQILSNGTALFPWVYFTSSMVHLWEHCAGFETQSQSYLRHSDSIIVNSLYASFHSCFC